MASVLHKITPEDFAVSNWSGGTTTQLAIGPAEAVYADRDFLWRISSATVTLPESDFTPLKDYIRYISPLQGEMNLSHNGGVERSLAPFEIHLFDGADATHARGTCTDFNLMLRKGRCEGSLCCLQVAENAVLQLPQQIVRISKNKVLVLYCVYGEGMLEIEGQVCAVSDKEAVLVSHFSAWPSLKCSKSSAFMVAEIVPL